MTVDCYRVADLKDPPGLHDRDPVGHGERLLLVVGNVDARDAEVLLQLAQLDLHVLAKFAVERAGAARPSAGAGSYTSARATGDTLLLAARELRARSGRRDRED